MKPSLHPAAWPALVPLLFLTACATSGRPDPAPATVWPPAPGLDSPAPLSELALMPAVNLPAMPAATSGFASTAASAGPVQTQAAKRPRPPMWDTGRTLLQGFLGATLYQEIERSGGSGLTVDGSDDELSRIPTIGGGAQWKLGGEEVDFGLEGMLAFNWRANATAFAIGGGGAAVAVDVDLFVFDLYGGPFASMFLGDRLRAYAAAGPLMQWAQYDQAGQSDASLDGRGSGFGLGLYARTGLEVLVGGGTMVGLGVRWSDSTIDLDGGQGELDLDGLQIAFTVSRFY